jgi:hypothetical protein
MRYELVATTYLPGQANGAAQAAAAAGHTDGLAAYWITEIGPLNQTVELWSKPRPAPAGDAPLDHESHKLTAIVGPTAPAAAGGIYEIRHYRLRPGMASAWVEIFMEALPEREKLSPIVGLFASDAGEADRVVHIWAYPDMNTRTAVRAAAQKDPAWSGFLAKSRAQKLTMRQDASIVLPAAHSPLK